MSGTSSGGNCCLVCEKSARAGQALQKAVLELPEVDLGKQHDDRSPVLACAAQAQSAAGFSSWQVLLAVLARYSAKAKYANGTPRIAVRSSKKRSATSTGPQLASST